MFPTYLPALLFWLVIVAGANPVETWVSAPALLPGSQDAGSGAQLPLLRERSSPTDLEVGGELMGVAPGSVRYVRYEDLVSLPQETYTVSDDTNFKGTTEISGVALTTLSRLFGQAASSNMIIAICYDKYRSNYPSEYLAAHHPILVLKINGKLRDQWPLSEDGGPLGPYLVSHPTFTPSFKVLSHEDEAQIPFGVIRLDFRKQSEVYAPIRPAEKWMRELSVMQGYEIARQDCYRCHGMHAEGGKRASRSWLILAAWAATDSSRFMQYVRMPQAVQPCAKMPAHAGYDDATLEALAKYFSTFIPEREHEGISE